ncbi:hypothetical protein VNI00_017183 [Paramarasmius palmivorus]|uniref:ABC transporter domain-containing protein n=1 Tax=Paramarasmius palmivorus TaxID=297713 RepID=A0AAW0B8L7_9AGAR
MSSLFWRQFKALSLKNWIVLSQHYFLNSFRCVILPIALGVFFAVAQRFFADPNNNGIGLPIAVYPLHEHFDGTLSLLWVDATTGNSSPSPSDIITRVTQNFSPYQKAAVKQVEHVDQVAQLCPSNFNGFSECFAGVIFYDIPSEGSAPVNYTIRADPGLLKVDVINHLSAFETRILPLQWAIDQAIILAQTGIEFPAPLEWPFTHDTNEAQATDLRLSAVTAERANLLTSHMKAMGLLESARIVSWHVSLSLAYIPAWTIVSIIWHYRIFTETPAGLVFIIHIIFGLVLASYSFFTSAPFGKSPQLAAVTSTLCSFVLAIIGLVFKADTAGAVVFSLFFPPSWYIFAIRAICGWELHQQTPQVLEKDPSFGLMLLPLLIIGILNIFLWPWLGCLLENVLYGARTPRKMKSSSQAATTEDANVPPDVAISIRNLKKTFRTSFFSKSKSITAVEDLSLDIPKNGIFVLLGSNGAGKSTILSILANLIGRTDGAIQFETEHGGNMLDRPFRGTLGIVPQKNVLFPDLSCYQTLRVWQAIKWSKHSNTDEDLRQLLRDCDLGAKMYHHADVLSGGQKRKLQLAIGLVGGSKVLLVDECTSGVDPLSRRAIWRTLNAARQERTIVLTTHFLDEADLLADNIAILAAPGKLVAQGTPVALKRNHGEGYTIQVTFDTDVFGKEQSSQSPTLLLQQIRSHAKEATMTIVSPCQALYHLKSDDHVVTEGALETLEEHFGRFNVSSWDILSTSIEDIFLDLMKKHDPRSKFLSASSVESFSEELAPEDPFKIAKPLDLTPGRTVSPTEQALTIFYKRLLISRRSWLVPLLSILVAVAGSTIPLVFFNDSEPTPCSSTQLEDNSYTIRLFLPLYGMVYPVQSAPFIYPLESPPGLLSTFNNFSEKWDGPSADYWKRYSTSINATSVPDNTTFVERIQQDYKQLQVGGISVDLDSGVSLVAWHAQSPGDLGPVMLNLASNVLYNHALNMSGNGARVPAVITAGYSAFTWGQSVNLISLFIALKWLTFFGAAMAVYPAFYAIYVSKERRSSVQAMQFSNGLTNPAGLWAGHLMFDLIFIILASTIIAAVFGSVASQLYGVGLLWLVMVLYGIAATLFAYCVTLFVSSPLAAFATVAGYEVLMFGLYITGYILTLTYAKSSKADSIMNTFHFTISLLSPIASLIRAGFVSSNAFSLLCKGDEISLSIMGDIMRFGGPILYLILWSVILFGVLVRYDSGSIRPFWKRRGKGELSEKQWSTGDLLQVHRVTKTFGSDKAVDNVTFDVAANRIFGLLGPNGGGKTTTFNMIRGDIMPDSGEILVNIRKLTASSFSARRRPVGDPGRPLVTGHGLDPLLPNAVLSATLGSAQQKA